MTIDTPGGAPDPEDPDLGGTSRFFIAPDGLRLHARDYGEPRPDCLPVVCLPGLARTAADFDVLARRLSELGRRVLAIDYRGRGRSDRDPDWKRYSIPIESADVQTILAQTAIERAIFVGTSRGGLHIMGLAVQRPSLIHAAALNDIGPKLEVAGLARIKGYIGKLPAATTWTEAIEAVSRVLGPAFDGLSERELDAYARLTLRREGSGYAPRYDARLAIPLAALDLTQPLPEIWDQFEALAAAPVLAIRGGNSDLLSAQTLALMTERHPNCVPLIVPGQGHAPLLLDEPTLSAIESFIAKADPKKG